MGLKKDLRYAEELARERIKQAEGVQKQIEIKERVSAPNKTPYTSSGVLFSEEGIETPLVAGEEMNIDFTLPAEELRWSLTPAQYRIKIVTDGPAVLDLYDDETNKQLVGSRRSAGRAIIDLKAGPVRLESTTSITDMEVRRFNKRGRGEIILGPYSAQGVVNASVVGHGSWKADLASDPMVKGTIDMNGTPSFEGPGSMWHGVSPDENQPPKPSDGNWLSWSVAKRFSNSPDADLKFYNQLRVDHVTRNHEIINQDTPTQTGDGVWWRGINDWRAMGGSEAPSFDPRPALWTYVWGTVSGQSRAYDMSTGRRAEPVGQGQYLVRSQAPENVSIEGVHASYGSVFTQEDKALLTPGRYANASKIDSPNQFFVRLQGSGVARKVELEITKKEGPKGMEVDRRRRIDLADYFRPGLDREHNLTVGGRGNMLQATAA